jgi:ribose transport system substrate-binding protein
MDSDAAGSRRLYFIGTNNLEAGRLGGKRVIEKLGGKGNVVFFTIGGQPNTEERLKGFKDVFASRPDIKIVDVVDIKGDARNAFDKTQEFLALTGAEEDRRVCLPGVGVGQDGVDAIKRAGGLPRTGGLGRESGYAGRDQGGTIDATIAQKPFTMGYVGLKALDEVFHARPSSSARTTARTRLRPTRCLWIPARRWWTRATWTCTSLRNQFGHCLGVRRCRDNDSCAA